MLQQVIEGINLQSGTYVLSWIGTAQGKIGAGSYGASGITGTVTGGTNLTIEFGPGTVSKVQFGFGSTLTPFESRPYGVELALCQRYFRKSFPDTVAPAQAGGTSGSIFFAATKAGVVSQYASVRFDPPMRTAAGPATITIYNPSLTNANPRDYSAGGDLSSASIAEKGSTGFELTCTGLASTVIGNACRFHYKAEDEL